MADPEDNNERKRVNLMVDARQKEEWKKAAEGPEYNGLSHLIRVSVTRELSDRSQQSTSRPASGPVEVELPNDLRATLDRLDRGLKDVKDRLDAIEGERRTEGQEYELAHMVLDVLPTPPDTEQAEELEHYDEWAMTPEDLANRLHEDPKNIEEALTRLQEMTSQLNGVVGGPENERFLWRQE